MTTYQANELVIISVAWLLLINGLIRPRGAPRDASRFADPPALISPEKCHNAANYGIRAYLRAKNYLYGAISFNFLGGERIFF